MWQINVLIKWCYRKKVLRNHEVHLTMIYYRMKFQSVGSAEFNTAYFHDFHALWFYEVDGLVQERLNSISNALELRISCTNPSKWKHFLHADFHVSLMVARTTCWTNTRVAGERWEMSRWDSITYDSYISVDLHAYETVLKYFSGFSREFNRNIRRSLYKY